MICGGHFDPEVKQKRIDELSSLINNPNFWDDKEASEKVLNELNMLKSKLSGIEKLKNTIESNLELANMLKVENDLEVQNMLVNDITNLKE